MEWWSRHGDNFFKTKGVALLAVHLSSLTMDQFNPLSKNEAKSPIDRLDDELPQVSEKNTKVELANAYKILLKKYEEKVKARGIEQAKKTADAEIVKKAGGYTVEGILQQIDSIKRTMESALFELSHSFLDEQKRLEEIRSAIKIEEDRLKELYEIEAASVKLEDFIKAQEVKKEIFEEEYERMRLMRKREQEEYEYTISQQRKREEDFHHAKEEDFKKREDDLRAQEKETQELRRKIDAFPRELTETTEKLRKETEERVEKEMRIQAELTAKEFEGEKKVFSTRINFLEELIAKQNGEIQSLKKELEGTMRQVHSIAEKAIEGAAGKQTLKAVSDIAMQQAGKSNPREGYQR